MQSDFYQHKLFGKRWFRFTDIGLNVSNKTLFKAHEYELKYEDIGTKVIYIKKGINRWLVPGCVLLFISLVLFIDRLNGGNVENGAEIFYMLPGLACLTGYILTFDRSCYLVKPNNTNGVKFLMDKSGKQQLTDFIDEIKEKRKKYLLNKYGELNKGLSYEQQFNNLRWLNDNDVLSENEFEEKKAELDSLLATNTVVAGFFKQ